MDAYPNLSVAAVNKPPPNRNWVFIVLAIVVAALLFYYFVLRGGGEKSCKDYTTEDECVLSPCFWNAQSNTCSNVMTSPPPPPPPPPDPESLTGHYIANKFDISAREWTDSSGKSNHISGVLGEVNLSDNLTYIYGGVDVKFKLPTQVFERDYTLITVAKYNGDNKKRIFTSSEGDWYSGHNDGKSGVAKHDVLITDDIDRHGDGWVVSVDQRNLYRSNGRTLTGKFLVQGYPSDIGVNVLSGLESDFAIAEIMIFNEEIDIEKIKDYEIKLMTKYGVTPTRFKLGKIKNGTHSDIFDSVNVDCGLNSGIRGLKMYSGDDTWWYEYSCMFDLDREGQFATVKSTAQKLKTENVLDTFLDENLACQSNPLQAFEIRKVSDKAEVNYTCSNAKVVTSTCRSVDSAPQDVNDFTAHEVLCDEDEVMTQFQIVKLPDDVNKARYSYTCCKPEGF